MESSLNTQPSFTEGDMMKLVGIGEVLAAFSRVSAGAYDPEVVKVLASNVGGLRAYFEHADALALKNMDVMKLIFRSVDGGVSASADPLDVVKAMRLGYDRAPPHVVVDKDDFEAFKNAQGGFLMGLCYMEVVRAMYLKDAHTRLLSWPTLEKFLSLPWLWVDVAQLVRWRIETTGDLAGHVRPAEGMDVMLTQLVSVVARPGRVWPTGSLGEWVRKYAGTRGAAGPVLSLGMKIGGDRITSLIPGGHLSVANRGPVSADGRAYNGAGSGGEPPARKYTVNEVIERVGVLIAFDRSRLWEALQLAGNGVDNVDGRVLLSGNKQLALVGDGALRLVLVGRCQGLRIGDIQNRVSSVLSNGNLARAGKAWQLGGMLQGSLPSGASDYVIATAVEAVAGAAQYGGGLLAVSGLLDKIIEATGAGEKYPDLR